MRKNHGRKMQASNGVSQPSLGIVIVACKARVVVDVEEAKM
jgi:hypothetical protein